jgi:hypothetical protein
LGYFAASNGSFLPTFQSHLQRSRIKKEIRLSLYGVYTRKSVDGDMISGAWCQLIELIQVVGREGGV